MNLIRKILNSLTTRDPVVQTARDSVVQTSDGTEQESSWDPSRSWYSSEEEELEERAQEEVWQSLEGARISGKKRRVLFPGGLRLTLVQAVGHLRKIHSNLPFNTVEGALIEWLEENTAPGNVTQEQMDAHDQMIEAWIADYREEQDRALEKT